MPPGVAVARMPEVAAGGHGSGRHGVGTGVTVGEGVGAGGAGILGAGWGVVAGGFAEGADAFGIGRMPGVFAPSFGVASATSELSAEATTLVSVEAVASGEAVEIAFGVGVAASDGAPVSSGVGGEPGALRTREARSRGGGDVLEVVHAAARSSIGAERTAWKRLTAASGGPAPSLTCSARGPPRRSGCRRPRRT